MSIKENIVLKTENLAIGYNVAGRKSLLMDNLSLNARSGELVALLGRNGSGKSTLMRTIVALQPSLGGSVMINSESINTIKLSELPRMVSFTSTEPVAVHNMNVREVVALGRFPYTNWLGSLSGADEEMINEAIEITGLTHLSFRNIDAVSDGERQRTLIARALAQNTDLLVMDEPTAFLDLPSKFSIINLLKKLTRDKGKCVVYSTHDLDSALNEADKVWLMTQTNVLQGAPEDLLLSNQLSKTFQSPGLSFNHTTGTFSFTRPVAGSLALNAHGAVRELTIKALRRCGYTIDNESPVKLNALEKQGITEWHLLSGNNSACFYSLYDLTVNLPGLI